MRDIVLNIGQRSRMSFIYFSLISALVAKLEKNIWCKFKEGKFVRLFKGGSVECHFNMSFLFCGSGHFR